MKLAALNEHAAAARLRVDALEQELAAAYLKALRAAGRKAASRFRGAASLAAPALTAATDPKWLPPDPGQLLDATQLAAQANKNAAPVQERALRLAVPVGIAFDLEAPLARQFLGGLADRTNRILNGFSDEIGTAIGEAHDQGLSIPKAAQLIRDRVESASLVQATLLARSDLVSIANGGSLLAAQLVNDASAGAGEGAANFKTWLTAGDERVRDTHAEADGQTVPLDQPFDIGGESLNYPGDPQGSDSEVLNCRCTMIYGDSMTAALVTASRPEVIRVSQEDFDAIQRAAVRAPTPALSSRGTMDETPEVTVPPLVLRDFHLTAAAGEPTRWQATLLVEDEPTEDGRMIQAGATTWRGLPLPLMATDVTADGHDGAELCGRIDQIWRAGRLVQGAGIFNDMADDPASRAFAADIVQKVRDRLLTGVSVDPVGCDVEIVVSQRAPAEDEGVADEVAEVIGEPVYEEPAIFDDDLEYLQVYTSLVLGGATICPFQAVANAQIEIVASAEPAAFVSQFEPSLCEVEPQQRTDLAVERLDAITASVDAVTERSQMFERQIGDRFESLTAAQVAFFDEIDKRLAKLARVAEDIDAMRALIEQKPRTVEIKRDGDGRLAGLVETR